jgi:hypothetical protein
MARQFASTLAPAVISLRSGVISAPLLTTSA